MKEDRVIKPDFVLVRNFPGDIHENRFPCSTIRAIHNRCLTSLPPVKSLKLQEYYRWIIIRQRAQR